MHSERDVSGPVPGVVEGGLTLLWTAAAAVAAFGTWVMFDALPGINWLLWTGAAAAGLAALARQRGVGGGTVVLTGAAATVIAGAAAVTASPVLHVLICGSVIVLLAMQMRLAANPSVHRISAQFAVTAPLLAFASALAHAIRRAIEATELIQSPRARARVRGLAITTPILIVFALLLAEADPTFASWRDGVFTLLNWDVVPRVVFFTALLGLVVGAYGYASREAHHDSTPTPGNASPTWLGTVVASATVVLIIVSERYGQHGTRERFLRMLTFALITAVLLLLGSAFRRVLLYEAAYGYTTARLYAQAYMTAVAGGLLWLSVEVAGELDAGRLFRRAASVAMLLFVALSYWNHEAWIAKRNIDRFATSGKLDVAYLANELSPDAIPAIAERLPLLPEPMRSELRRAVQKRYAPRREMTEGRWYEWNLGRVRGKAVFRTVFVIAADD
ncbi:MAG: DUF4173 domain-containing protein [Gemmatimonadaceae bacterium]|nr:DUF4173 domain-containing protein [Gemmatimonadaceae bacterium]